MVDPQAHAIQKIVERTSGCFKQYSGAMIIEDLQMMEIDLEKISQSADHILLRTITLCRKICDAMVDNIK